LHPVIKKTLLSIPGAGKLSRLRQGPATEVEPVVIGNVKHLLATQYLSGKGIEIGAFNNPMPHAPDAVVRYLDRYSTEDLQHMYQDADCVDVDIVDDGEKLESLEAASQDFIVASHFFEHCQNPIGTLTNLLRVVRAGGIVFIVIPDKRFTFDKVREVTPFRHILDDFQKGPAVSERAHYEEWARVIDKLDDPEEHRSKVEHFIETRWPIHFHVWRGQDILEMFYEIRQLPEFDYDVCAFHEDGQWEATVVLQKISDPVYGTNVHAGET